MMIRVSVLIHRSLRFLWIFIGVTALYFVPKLIDSARLGKAGQANSTYVTLNESDLPSNIDGWSIVKYQPPDPKYYEKTHAWVSSWTFKKANMLAIVSFDQLGLRGWHELTECYVAIGWEVDKRSSIPSETNPSWNHVLASLSRSQSETATLIFSIHDGLGEPMQQPLSASDVGLGSALKNRIAGDSWKSESNLTLQSQVLIAGIGELSDEHLADVTRLHLSTREMFRKAWMHKSPTLRP